MPTRNEELLARRLDRWLETRRANPEDFADGFVWDMSTFRGWPEQLTWDGPEGMDAFMEEWVGAWDDWSLEVVAIREGDPGQVVVECRQRGVERSAGVPVEMHFAQLWTVGAEGRTTRMRMYADVEEALAEAGVSAA